ncbi:hypothetical protein LCGC14_1485540, partial [marine sediment metagenome]
MDEIKVQGARIHNLKNIDVSISKKKITLITGVSGSGKSSLAFDIIFDEGMNRYLQAIGFPPKLEDEKPFDLIEGLSPTIAVEQRTTRVINPRSTVGTKTGMYGLLRMFYAIEGVLLCPICKIPVDNNLKCESCGMVRERFEIKHFSFNELSGMCLECRGRGYTMHLTEDLIVQDPIRNLMQITKAGSAVFADQIRFVEQLPRFYDFDIKTSYKDLPDSIKQVFLYGSGKKLPFKWDSKSFTGILEREFEGIIPHVNRALVESKSAYRRQKIHKNFMKINKCEECNGYKLNEASRDVKIAEKHIGELAMMSIDDLKAYLDGLTSKEIKTKQGKNVLEKLQEKLQNMLDVGLTYLHLNRGMPTLSGGELQRTAISFTLLQESDVYLIDEPCTYLDVKQRLKLRELFIRQINRGKPVIVVEHDLAILDYLTDNINILFGTPHVFGMVSRVIATKKGINSFLNGYLADENISIRTKSINFRRSARERTFGSTEKKIVFESFEKNLGQFKLLVNPASIYQG